MQVDGPAFRPTRWRFIERGEEVDEQVVREGGAGVRDVVCDIPGHGMFWEADECGRCIRDVSFSFRFPCFFFLAFLCLFFFVCSLLYVVWDGDRLLRDVSKNKSCANPFSFFLAGRGNWKVKSWAGKRVSLSWRRWIR